MSFTSRLTSLAAAGVGGVSYWANDLANGADRQSNSYWIDFDSNKNVFVGGYYHVSNGYNRMDIMELDSDGNYVRGVRNGTGTQEQTTGHGACIQSNDRVLVSGVDYGTPRSTSYYSRESGGNNFYFKHRHVYSNDNSEGAGVYRINNYIYGCEWRQVGSLNEVVAIRAAASDFSSSSRVRYSLRSGSDDFAGLSNPRLCDVTADSNDNIIIAAHADDNIVGKLYLASLDSSGGLNFKHTYLRGHNNSRQVRVLCDSNNNIYFITGSAEPGGAKGINIAKFNSSGTLQWQNKYSSTNNSEDEYYLSGCDIDGNDNLYIAVWNYNEPFTNTFFYYTDIIQVNTSGTLVDTCGWRGNNSNVIMMNVNSGAGGHGLKIDEDGTLYTQICYRVNGTDNEFRRRFVAKFSMNLSGSNVGTTNLTWTPSGRINQESSCSLFDTSNKDTNPGINVNSATGVTIASSNYTNENIAEGNQVDESLSSL